MPENDPIADVLARYEAELNAQGEREARLRVFAQRMMKDWTAIFQPVINDCVARISPFNLAIDKVANKLGPYNGAGTFISMDGYCTIADNKRKPVSLRIELSTDENVIVSVGSKEVENIPCDSWPVETDKVSHKFRQIMAVFIDAVLHS